MTDYDLDPVVRPHLLRQRLHRLRPLPGEEILRDFFSRLGEGEEAGGALLDESEVEVVRPDPDRVVQEMRDRLKANPIVLQIPHVLEDEFNGIVDLVHMRSRVWDDATLGAQFHDEEIPEYLRDDAELARVMGTFENLWKDPNGEPTAVYIGCPHNTYDEILYWAKKLDSALKAKGQEKLAIPVVMACPIVVRNRLLDEHPILLRDVLRAGVRFTTICTPAYQGLKGMADIDRGVTNSNKARFYSRLRLFGDDDLLQIAMTGKLPA